MNKTQYEKSAFLFNRLASSLRQAYREGRSASEIAEIADEIDSFCRRSDYPMIRARGAELLNQSRAMATGNTA